MARPKAQITKPEGTYFEKLEKEVRSNQSTLSLILGGLIVLVVGVLIFNYFNRPTPQLGPAQQTQGNDVSVENLPGKYTVKENDTLFQIAEKYYKDGYKYTEIAKTNNLTNADDIEKGQVLEIPKLELAAETPITTPVPDTTVPAGEKGAELGTGTGGGNTTIWGSKIEEDSYTVVEGDWLSTIAGRAYGDIQSYKKLAETNNIQNPDLILPGQVLKIPR